MRRSMFIALLFSLIVSGARFGAISAQHATPTVSNNAGQLDLAVMALTSDELGAQVSSFGEVYSPVPESPDAAFIPVFTAKDLSDAGIRRAYTSALIVGSWPEQMARVYVVLLELESIEIYRRAQSSATPELGYSLPGESTGQRTIEGIGETGGLLTVTRSPADGSIPSFTEASLTFLVGNIVTNVSVAWFEGISVGKPSPIDLGKALERRIERVLDGKSVSGIDYELPNSMLKMGQNISPEYEGYLADQDVFGPFAASFWNPLFVSGYRRAAHIDPVDGSGARMPEMTVTVLEFDSGVTAQRVVKKGAMPLLDQRDAVDAGTAVVANASKTRWSWYSNSWDGPIDSFGIKASTGRYVVVVEVAEASDATESRGIAIELMEKQIGCINKTGLCNAQIVPHTN